MPRHVTPGSSFWARLRGDPLVGNGSGDDAPNALAFEQFNRDIGLLGEAAATTDTGGFSLLSFFQRLLQRITLVYKEVPSNGTAVKVAIVEGGGVLGTTAAAMTQLSANLTQDNLLLAANPARRSLIVNNRSGAVAYVLVGPGTAAIAAGGYSYAIPNNGAIEDDYRGELRVICGPGAVGFINVTERS